MKEDPLTIGNAISIKKAAEIIDQVNGVVAQWEKYADEVAISPSLRDQIAKTLIRLE